ncbi:MAG: hypothetical protein M4579_006083 [Chaenotheca gracillima]|nr:MAG: hypothetical protein M4579_006083 [Chaenotheca gracillima]
MTEEAQVDYSLNNPDTLTKYKTAAQISQNVLQAISKECVDGASILELCKKGDKLLDDETAKVFKGKKIFKGEGVPEVGEVWGVEVGMSLGSGKIKTLENRTTLHRRTTLTYGLKRPSSRAILSEVVKKFGTFPFSLRQLDDERAAKVGVVECVRGNVLRQYEVVGDKDGDSVARVFSTIAITKNGIQRLSSPPTPDLSKLKTDKKIEDEEILKILEQPASRSTGSKSKNKKKKKKPSAKKAATAEDDEESSDDE